MTGARAAIATAARDAVAAFRPTPVVYDYPYYPGLSVAPVAVVVAPVGLDRDFTWHQVAVLVSGMAPADQAQDWLDDLVAGLDDGLRSGLSTAYALLRAGTTEETGWDRVGWLDELDCWAAQVAVGHFRARW
jgi:hypothetical protein